MRNDRFETLVGAARQTVRQLASHDPAYEATLHSGTVSSNLNAAVAYAFSQLQCALDQLASEILHRCELPNSQGRPSYPLRTADMTESFESILESAFPGLLEKRPDVSEQLLNLQDLADSDGWLKSFAALAEHPESLQLKRATGRATLSRTADSGMELALTSATGETIPTFAPVLIDGIAGMESGNGKAFYLAVGPHDREVVSFLDRCVRGVEHLGAAIRAVLAHP